MLLLFFRMDFWRMQVTCHFVTHMSFSKCWSSMLSTVCEVCGSMSVFLCIIGAINGCNQSKGLVTVVFRASHWKLLYGCEKLEQNRGRCRWMPNKLYLTFWEPNDGVNFDQNWLKLQSWKNRKCVEIVLLCGLFWTVVTLKAGGRYLTWVAAGVT